MLMQLLQFPFVGDRSQAWRNGNDLCDSMRHRVQTRLRTPSKQQYWHTAHKIQKRGTLV